MSDYRRLTRAERYQIERGLGSGQSLREIARSLDRCVSSISREVRRNQLEGLPGAGAVQRVAYEAPHAELRARLRKEKKRPRREVISGNLEGWVKERLLQDWSPEQIAGRLKKTHPDLRLSHPTIYRYVYKDALFGGKLHEHLRTARKRRTKKCNRKPYSSPFCIPKVSIRKRPAVVSKRKRLGDYERDTICGTGQDQSEGVVLSIVDRTSRLTKLRYLPKKTARATHQATLHLLQGLIVRSITNDNGPEFADHHRTQEKLKAKVYFCHPRSFWERGTNENTNGLVRQYLPRSLDFRKLDPKQVKRAEKLLNGRPRKCLGYRTPHEVHRRLSIPKVLHC